MTIVNFFAYIVVALGWPAMSAPLVLMATSRTTAWGLWFVGFFVSIALGWSALGGELSPSDQERSPGAELLFRLLMFGFAIWPAALSLVLWMVRRAPLEQPSNGKLRASGFVFCLYLPFLLGLLYLGAPTLSDPLPSQNP
ncbi:hypothetical protein [Aminobacter sp. HY435]|uniref:hypothetical protein n=1 Tax=Aminobacter sp. HY435 TaxID=2970917 RepID=UPI0022B955F9|nr:hypothetical protein [Aminobacter sp. HY435]